MEPGQAMTAGEALVQADRALQGGDLAGAVRLYRLAVGGRPNDPAIRMQIAHALRLMGDLDGALTAIENALVADPYLLGAHLAKGAVLEKLGRRRAAAESYRIALMVVPSRGPAPQHVAALESTLR